jgi:hypothetical protein
VRTRARIASSSRQFSSSLAGLSASRRVHYASVLILFRAASSAGMISKMYSWLTVMCDWACLTYVHAPTDSVLLLKWPCLSISTRTRSSYERSCAELRDKDIWIDRWLRLNFSFSFFVVLPLSLSMSNLEPISNWVTFLLLEEDEESSIALRRNVGTQTHTHTLRSTFRWLSYYTIVIDTHFDERKLERAR